ncbi:hypothetical protein BVY03_04855 [bacterium K02(2017)]|nr:hypothetical protein BVY03_04855 [bacterium K02(2017)]
MKAFLAALILFLSMLASVYFYGLNIHQDLASMDGTIHQNWAKLENSFLTRAELVPELISIAKDFDFLNKRTIQDIQQRNKAAKRIIVEQDQSKLLANYQSFQSLQKSQNDLTDALTQLWIEVKANRQFKPGQEFMALKTKLEMARVNLLTEKQAFNSQVKSYNKQVRSFPDALVALAYGFNRKVEFNGNLLETNAK